jgi:pyruvate kinase
VLHDQDKEALKSLSADYEIDFLSLSFCRAGDDVLEARSFLKSIGLTNTKVPKHSQAE